MHLGNSLIKTRKIILCSSNVLFLWGFPVGADYSKSIRKIFDIWDMYYSIRVPNRIERYSIRYSNVSNIRTALRCSDGIHVLLSLVCRDLSALFQNKFSREKSALVSLSYSVCGLTVLRCKLFYDKHPRTTSPTRDSANATYLEHTQSYL